MVSGYFQKFVTTQKVFGHLGIYVCYIKLKKKKLSDSFLWNYGQKTEKNNVFLQKCAIRAKSVNPKVSWKMVAKNFFFVLKHTL